MHRTEGGRFTQTPDASDVSRALLIDRLRKVLETQMDANGNQAGIAPAEQLWAVRVGITRPQWALDTLKGFGL